MEYWIDGYNLLFKLSLHLKTLQENREKLITELKLHLIKSRLSAKIVFDSSEKHGSSLPSLTAKAPLEVIFSPAKMSADDYIIEMLSHTKSAKNIVIVTNDSHLAFRIKEYKASVVSIDDFFKRVFAKEQKHHLSNYEFLKEEGIHFDESEENIQLFVKIFEERQNRNNLE